MSEKMLVEAIGLAREGRTTEARWLLLEVLRRDRNNEAAWLWLADCAETPEERHQALETCLRRCPGSARARAALETDTLAVTTATAGLPASDALPSTASLSAPAALPADAMPQSAWVPLEAATALPVAETQPVKIRAGWAGQAAALDAPAVDVFVPQIELFVAPELHQEEAPWSMPGEPYVFTIPPESISPEEFATVEARTITTLDARTGPRLAEQIFGRVQEDWSDLGQITGQRARYAARMEGGMVTSAGKTANWAALTAAAALLLLALIAGAIVALTGL